MKFPDIEKKIDKYFEIELEKNKSQLSKDIEIKLSHLARDGLASSGVALKQIGEICFTNYKNFVKNIFDRLKEIVKVNKYEYEKTCDDKFKKLISEKSEVFSEYCKQEFYNTFRNPTMSGSTESYMSVIDNKMNLFLKEIENDIDLFCDELEANSKGNTLSKILKIKEIQNHPIIVIIGILGSIASIIGIVHFIF